MGRAPAGSLNAGGVAASAASAASDVGNVGNVGEVGEVGEVPAVFATPAAEGSPGLFRLVGAELSRWGKDSAALVTAPLSWDGTDWARFGSLSAGVGGLMLADKKVYEWVEDHRTSTSDRVANAIAPFGAEYAVGVSAALLVGGLVFKDPVIRDAGRDAIEASVISAVLVNVVLKPSFGRERPYDSGGETVFHPFSSNASFPSGHTTEAFAVASVVAMRSDGWFIPTIAYTTASLVAVARVEQSAHFASDVFAGAVLGTVVGRFVVARNWPAKELAGPSLPPAVRVTLLAISGGLALHAAW